MAYINDNGFVVLDSQNLTDDKCSRVCKENSFAEMIPRNAIDPMALRTAKNKDVKSYIRKETAYIKYRFAQDQKMLSLIKGHTFKECLTDVWYERYTEKKFLFLLHTLSSKKLSGYLRVLLTEADTIEKQCRILENALGIKNSMLVRDLHSGSTLLWKLCQDYYEFKNPVNVTV